LNPTYIFLGVPLVMYILQALVVYAPQGRWGMCLALLAYALANAGFIWDAVVNQ
jgi:hypothetical protein